MERSWYLRCAVVVGILVAALYVLYPSYYYFYQADEAARDDNEEFCRRLAWWGHCTKFNLGLDLQGGVHLVMGVRTDKAIEQRADRLADALRESLLEQKLVFTGVDRTKNSDEITVALAAETARADVEKLIRREYQSLDIASRGDHELRLRLSEEESKLVAESAVDQAIKTIRNRADRLGVTEPTIAKRGRDSVLIQLPGVKDPQRAIDIIGRTAQLQFTMVDEAGTAVFDEIADTELPPGVKREQYTFDGPQGPVREVYFDFDEASTAALLALLEPKVPSNRTLAYGPLSADDSAPQAGRFRTYLLDARPGITGDYLTDATVRQNPDLPSDYYVTMDFDPKGARIFEKLTEENVKRHMAIVLDGRVNSAPIIQEKIGGGTARITLGGAGDARKKFEEARDMALVLKAGALPAPVEIREKRQIGKSLGKDSVSKGALAIVVGTLLVVIFMLIYYRGSGLIANIALTLNVLLVLAALAFFEATLTLPGMAGIVLVVGMAVDANVIIFERIREELRVGKTPRAAVEAGYSKAFSTIVDSNITTLIAGVVLIQYGSGPVRGFAVTLIIGILCSMFTAIVVTRLIYDFFTSRRRLQTLSI